MKLTKLEKLFCYLLFLLVWLYLCLRGDSVFYVHDEIVSKWSYMIDWNFRPYKGYIDANNHFLNSFLGGMFIRLFGSDNILIVRLGSILAFPLYFFSLYSLKPLFRFKWPFFFLLISCCCSQFLLDFFSLARGYALAWSFLVAALATGIKYLEKNKIKWGFFSLAFCLLSAYANLSFLPTVLSCIGLIAWISYRHGQLKHFVLPLILSLGAFLYLLFYAFELQNIGKLYLGSANNYFATVVEPISNYLFNTAGFGSNLLFVLISLATLLFLIKDILKIKSLNGRMVFPLLFILSTSAILLQNLLLGINFPEDRGVGYLLVLFLGSLAFLLDRQKFAYASIPFLLLFAIFFGLKANLSHTLVYDYEHFDEQLLHLIPEETEGIPTSTGGRFWAIDNELSRTGKWPSRSFQNSPNEEDTLSDYIITLKELQRNLPLYYETIYEDTISSLSLYRRKQFLKRQKIDSQTTTFDNNHEFTELYSELSSEAVFIQINGNVEEASIFRDYPILVTAENEESKEQYFYQGFGPISSAPITAEGAVHFNLTYALNKYSENSRIKIYIYNPKHYYIKGSIEVLIHKIL